MFGHTQDPGGLVPHGFKYKQDPCELMVPAVLLHVA
jgi:hypothetical protein